MSTTFFKQKENKNLQTSPGNLNLSYDYWPKNKSRGQQQKTQGLEQKQQSQSLIKQRVPLQQNQVMNQLKAETANNQLKSPSINRSNQQTPQRKSINNIIKSQSYKNLEIDKNKSKIQQKRISLDSKWIKNISQQIKLKGIVYKNSGKQDMSQLKCLTQQAIYHEKDEMYKHLAKKQAKDLNFKYKRKSQISCLYEKLQSAKEKFCREKSNEIKQLKVNESRLSNISYSILEKDKLLNKSLNDVQENRIRKEIDIHKDGQLSQFPIKPNQVNQVKDQNINENDCKSNQGDTKKQSKPLIIKDSAKQQSLRNDYVQSTQNYEQKMTSSTSKKKDNKSQQSLYQKIYEKQQIKLKSNSKGSDSEVLCFYFKSKQRQNVTEEFLKSIVPKEIQIVKVQNKTKHLSNLYTSEGKITIKISNFQNTEVIHKFQQQLKMQGIDVIQKNVKSLIRQRSEIRIAKNDPQIENLIDIYQKANLKEQITTKMLNISSSQADIMQKVQEHKHNSIKGQNSRTPQKLNSFRTEPYPIKPSPIRASFDCYSSQNASFQSEQNSAIQKDGSKDTQTNISMEISPKSLNQKNILNHKTNKGFSIQNQSFPGYGGSPPKKVQLVNKLLNHLMSQNKRK